MPVRIMLEAELSIPISDLIDGQLAEIVTGERAGSIVQAHDGVAIIVGCGTTKLFTLNSPYRVRVLPNGTHLVVEDNE